MSESQSMVFTPYDLGGVRLKNRLVRSATGDFFNHDDGLVNDETQRVYRELAAGGAGLIITGHAAAQATGLAGANMTRAFSDEYIPSLARMAQAVHETDPEAKVFLQLNHPGPQVPPGHAGEPVAADFPKTPIEMRGHAFTPPRPLTTQEVEQLAEDFAQGVRRAREAGFDGAQIHSAHGWLLSTFLSPAINHRTDAYGGSTAARCKLLVDIAARARQLAGADFHLGVKYNVDDLIPGGMNASEAAAVGVTLKKAGYSHIETSSGMWLALLRSEEELGFPPVPIPEARTRIRSPEGEAYNREGARAIREATGLPVLLVGGIKSLGVMERVIGQGAADLVSMCRPFLREPDLPRRLAQGQERAACISCNFCLLKQRPQPGQSRCWVVRKELGQVSDA